MAIGSLYDVQLTLEELEQARRPAETSTDKPKPRKGFSLLNALESVPGVKSGRKVGNAIAGFIGAGFRGSATIAASVLAPAESISAGLASGFKDIEAMNRPFEEGYDIGPLGTFKPVGADNKSNSIAQFTRDVVGTGIEATVETASSVVGGPAIAGNFLRGGFIKALRAGAKPGAAFGGGTEFGASIRERETLFNTALRTGFGTAAGALIGGVSAGFIPMLRSVLRPETRQMTQELVKKPAAFAGAKIEEFVEKQTRVGALSPLERNAVNSGLDDSLVSSVSRSAREEGNQPAFLEMLGIAEKKTGDMFHREMIEQVPGRAVLDRASFLIDRRREAGAKIGQLMDSIGKQTTDFTGELTKFRQDMAALGVQVNAKGLLRSTGRLSEADTKILQTMYDLVRPNEEGIAIRTAKQVQAIRQRLFDEFDLAKKPDGSPLYTGAVERVGDNLHSYLIRAIDRVDERYGVLAKEYAMTNAGIRPIAQLMQYKGKLDALEFKDLKAGEIARRMGGNAADRTISAVNDLQAIAVELGYEAKDNIYDQVIFASMLRKIYGLGQPNALEGSITQGIAQTALNLGTGNPVGALIRGIDNLIAPSRKAQQKALRELVENALEKVDIKLPAKVNQSDIPVTLHDKIRAIETDEIFGYTSNLDGTEYVGKDAITTLRSKTLTFEEATPEAIQGLVDEGRALFGDNDLVKIGVFKMEGGGVSVDFNITTADRELAEYIARFNNQESFWDAATESVMPTGGTGEQILTDVQIRDLLEVIPDPAWKSKIDEILTGVEGRDILDVVPKE